MAPIPQSAPAGASADASRMPGFGLVYDRREEYYEHEETSFAAAGVIHTSDGQQVHFDLHLNMAREFRQQENVHIRLGEALKNPLVVYFSGTDAHLLQSTHLFDIDANGEMDTISHLRPESGFLALDADGDGTVNDSSELFGALSGNGFDDLVQYDSDGNGWIDENDAIFVDLRIWVKDTQSNELVTLEKKRNRSDLFRKCVDPVRDKIGGERQARGDWCQWDLP